MESMGAAISELQQDLAKMTQQMQMLESRKMLEIHKILEKILMKTIKNFKLYQNNVWTRKAYWGNWKFWRLIIVYVGGR